MNQFNFDNVDDAGKGFTQPGTIGIFTIKEVNFGNSTNKQTPYMELVLEDESSSFKEAFYLTAKALPKVQHMALATGEKISGDVTEDALKARFVNKKAALKVFGSVNEEKGTVYASLGFGGFAKPVDKLSELSWSTKELADIEKFAAIVANSSSANADTETIPGQQSLPGTGGSENDDF